MHEEQGAEVIGPGAAGAGVLVWRENGVMHLRRQLQILLGSQLEATIVNPPKEKCQ